MASRGGTTFTMDTFTLLRVQAEAWDEGRHARPQYLGPDDGHYDGCMGWEDCDCATYSNPYREDQAPPDG